MNKTLIFLALSTTLLIAQDLRTTIEEVINTNPTIQERLKNYNATKEDVAIAKAEYYPTLDLSIGLGIENNQEKTRYDGQSTLIEEGGPNTTDTTTLSVYQNSLTFTQNIFNGFSTTNKVTQQEHRTTSAAYSYIENVNDISFKMVDTYLQVMRNRDLLKTAQANVDINEEIFKKVQKLYDAGLTTLSEVNKIESSLSLAKSNYVVQENTLLDVTYNMQRVFGRYLEVEKMQKPVLNVALPASIEDAAQYAIKNNPSLLVAAYNVKLAQAGYKQEKSSYYPTIDIEISQNMNKNLSGIEGNDNRLRAMAYLKYNLFNGFSDEAKIQKSISKIHQEVESKNDLRRQVLEGLNLSWAANEKLGDQLEHLNEYKKFSLKTLTLYAKEYDLGRRSLLDLLSAQNDFIGAKQQIINTEYSMLFAKYRILDAMGILVKTILEQTDIIYSNVGLNGKKPQNMDKLPIHYDKDLDLIVDEFDLCSNSLTDKMRSVYGCKLIFEDILKIERYSGFYFNDSKDKAAILSEAGEKRLNNLIKQVAPYGFKYLNFDILGNVDDNEMSELDKMELSKQRALYVRDQLLKAGATEENIKIHANSDKAPMFSRELDDAIEKNNRVDIIVKKLNK
ncbi:MAG: TolC family outer membrane protein [Thiovulaceae bacterium]|nr:TolC family outer membrane protein [Sulfurimonadaceae bacterium]